MAKPNLKLIICKPAKKNIFQKFWHWLNEPRCIEITLPFVLTQLEKEEAIQNFLTQKYAEYQLTTGNVGLFPLCEAMNEVERLKREGQIDAYYRKIKRKIKA